MILVRAEVEKNIKSVMELKTVLQVGVKILLKNKEGKFLLLKRSREKYPEVEKRWDIVGGRINAGKTLLENLKREVLEETGLKLVGTPKLIFAQDILKNVGQHVIRLTFLGKAKGKIKLDKKENDEYKWYSLEELNSLKDINFYLKGFLKERISELK